MGSRCPTGGGGTTRWAGRVIPNLRPASACPTTPAATRRATCSPRRTPSSPTDKPTANVLTAMVTRWRQAADDAGLEEAAKRPGQHPGRADDHRIAGRGRGPRRRHARGRPGHLQPARRPRRQGGGTYGLLQIDASVNYAPRRTARRGDHAPTRTRGGLAVQHLHAKGLPPARSRRPATTPSGGAATPRTGRGSST